MIYRVPAAQLANARKLMHAMGLAGEVSTWYSVATIDGTDAGNITHYAAHAWNPIIPDTLPTIEDWSVYGLTQEQAEEAFASIVAGSPTQPTPSQQLGQVLSDMGGAPAYDPDRIYQKNEVAFLTDTVWQSTIDNNVFAPGVEGWTELAAPGELPPITQRGSTNAYPLGFEGTYNGETYRSLVPNNVWLPDTAPATWQLVDSGEPSNAWAPGLSVLVDEEYTYDGRLYRVIQAHTTQAAWTPPVVPALFEDIGPAP